MARMRLRDIAAQAGVSPATVSKYLNGHFEAMAPATRARIAEVVERTGYRPNSVARSLRLDRSHTLGVILADIRNPYSSAMLEELSAQAASAGYALTCAISGNDHAKEADALARLLEAGVDGLIVNTCGDNDEHLLQVNQRVPVVLLDRDLTRRGAHEEGVSAAAIDLVTSNNADLVAQLVDEVAGMGGKADGQPACTRVHLLTEASATSSIRRERALTFMQAISERGLAGSTLVLPTEPHEAARQLAKLAAAHEPLGLIAINGLVFQQLVEAIAGTGLPVPGRLRVATFDEYPWNRALFGGVTTAAQDTHGIASAVLERLIARIGRDRRGRTGASSGAGKTSEPLPRRVEIPGHVIRRASTA